MIGLTYLHREKMAEACEEWCKEAKDMFDAIKTGKARYKYKSEMDGKTYYFTTLYDKVDFVSKERLEILAYDDDLSDTNYEVAEILRQDELAYVFTDIEKFLGLYPAGIKKEAERCDERRKREYLAFYVYECLKEAFGDLYTLMRNAKQDDVFKTLNVRTCPYCNRQYTFTLVPEEEGAPYASPEFDHFFPKSQYPTLVICFYNLVPSCHCCNHGKSARQLHLNPYSHSFTGHFYVCDEHNNVSDQNTVLHIKRKEDVHITYKGTAAEEEDVKTLGLDQLYSMHNDYVEEIINKTNAYNWALNRDLADAFEGFYHSSQEVYDFVWGRHLEIAEQEYRPLSKFTRDILEQVGIKR